MNIFHKVSKQDQIDLLYNRLDKLSDDIKELYEENRKLRRILENHIPGKITFTNSNGRQPWAINLHGVDIWTYCNDKTFIYKDGKEYVIDNLYLSENTVLTASPTQNNVVIGTNKEGTVYINLFNGHYIWTERNQAKEHGDK